MYVPPHQNDQRRHVSKTWVYFTAHTKCHKDEWLQYTTYGKAEKPMDIHNNTFRLKAKNKGKVIQQIITNKL